MLRGERGMAMSDFRMMKCAKDEHKIVDRISQLPNEVLVQIFSFLRLEDAARTSILSKRWRDVWMFVVGLDFDASKVLDRIAAINNPIRHEILRKRERRKYVRWVNEVLELNKVKALDTFRICFDLDKAFQNEIDRWLQYAFARRVQSLELNLLEDRKKSRDSSRAYPFPNGLIFEKSPEELHSDCCGNGIHSPKLNFKFLRALIFRSVDVSGDVLQFFLQSCPSLEHLVVDSSQELKSSFEVCGPSLALKYLEICNCLNLASITLCDTNIVSLKITHVEKLVLKSVPTLENVWVSGSSKKSLVNAVIPRLFCCFSKLEVLTLQATAYHVRREKRVSVIRPELTNLKQLILVAEASNDDSLIAFTSLIMASPNLEKFVLKLEWGGSIARKSRESKKALHYPLQHLRVVGLYGYYGRTSEVELVEYFLENAVALERIIVDPHDQPISGRRRNQAEKEESARNHAQEQLKGLVPSHVELKLLDL